MHPQDFLGAPAPRLASHDAQTPLLALVPCEAMTGQAWADANLGRHDRDHGRASGYPATRRSLPSLVRAWERALSAWEASGAASGLPADSVTCGVLVVCRERP